jgi:hypothetical protein
MMGEQTLRRDEETPVFLGCGVSGNGRWRIAQIFLKKSLD